MRSTILIVDDSPMVIHLLLGILEEYHLKFALNGEDALKIVRENPDIDLILLDIEMPIKNGYEVLSELKMDPKLSEIPVIYLTAKDDFEEEAKGLEMGAVDYIKKPMNTAILKARVETHINLRFAKVFIEKQNEILENKVRQRTREIIITRDITINSMMSLLEVRDIESGHHIKRTQFYIQELCNYLSKTGPYKSQLTKEKVINIFRTAPLHDIGKVGIPDKILLKPGKLTAEEFEIMKKHTTHAIQAFSNVDERLGDTNFLNIAKEIAGSHHERWDGKGYPYGLKGNEIPIPGRMMAIADVYDALVNKRVYKEAFSHEESVKIILAEKGKQFDPVMIDAFKVLENKFRLINVKYSNTHSY